MKLLKDYKYLIEDEIPEYTYGIIETIICSYARVFVGTKASTYTGYIQRYVHRIQSLSDALY